MNNDLLLGIGSIIIGIFSLWFTRKYPTKGRDMWLLDFKGYAGGAILIIAGLLCLAKAISYK